MTSRFLSLFLGLFFLGGPPSQAAEKAEESDLLPLAPVTPAPSVSPGLNVERFADTTQAFAPPSQDLVLTASDLQRIRAQLASQYLNQNQASPSKSSHIDLGFSHLRVVEKKSQSGQWAPYLDLGPGFSAGPAVDTKTGSSASPQTSGLSPDQASGLLSNVTPIDPPPLQTDAKGTPLRDQDMGYQEIPLPDEIKLQLIEASFQVAASRGQSVSSRDKAKEMAAVKRMHLQMINVGGKMTPLLIFDPAKPDGKTPGSLPDGPSLGEASGSDPDQRFNLSTQDTLELLKIVGEKSPSGAGDTPPTHGAPAEGGFVGHGVVGQ